MPADRGHPIADLPRIELLAGRVRWLDLHRRRLAIAAVVVLAPFVVLEITAFLGPKWPRVHIALMTLMLGVLGWWLIEVGLAWLTAIWESERDRLLSDRGLPRAELRRK